MKRSEEAGSKEQYSTYVLSQQGTVATGSGMGQRHDEHVPRFYEENSINTYLS